MVMAVARAMDCLNGLDFNAFGWVHTLMRSWYLSLVHMFVTSRQEYGRLSRPDVAASSRWTSATLLLKRIAEGGSRVYNCGRYYPGEGRSHESEDINE